MVAQPIAGCIAFAVGSSLWFLVVDSNVLLEVHVHVDRKLFLDLQWLRDIYRPSDAGATCPRLLCEYSPLGCQAPVGYRWSICDLNRLASVVLRGLRLYNGCRLPCACSKESACLPAVYSPHVRSCWWFQGIESSSCILARFSCLVSFPGCTGKYD